MSSLINKELTEAYESLKTNDFQKAKLILEDKLSDNLEDKEIKFTLKCTTFWILNFPTILNKKTAYEKGESILVEWNEFVKYLKDEIHEHEQSINAVRQGIFNYAIECYQRVLHETVLNQKAEILYRLGQCNKKLGDYETALTYLGEASQLNNESAAILAEMADCYALCGDEKTSKVLFREAFFISPSSIDINFLESELITRLTTYVEKTICKKNFCEYIPVYGVLLGIFNIKRELRALEVGKLKQSIYALENELKDASNNPELIKPRLLNRYFWLVDYYITSHEDKSKINEVLLKIKVLDGEIYNKYIA